MGIDEMFIVQHSLQHSTILINVIQLFYCEVLVSSLSCALTKHVSNVKRSSTNTAKGQHYVV